MGSFGQEDRIALVKREIVHVDFIWATFIGMMKIDEIAMVTLALYLMVVTVATRGSTTAVERIDTPITA